MDADDVVRSYEATVTSGNVSDEYDILRLAQRCPELAQKLALVDGSRLDKIQDIKMDHDALNRICRRATPRSRFMAIPVFVQKLELAMRYWPVIAIVCVACFCGAWIAEVIDLQMVTMGFLFCVFSRM